MRIIYAIVFVFFASCINPQKENITELVFEWNGKEILFLKKTVFTIQGEDTVDFSCRNAEYKMVSYFDPLRCISCKLQLR